MKRVTPKIERSGRASLAFATILVVAAFACAPQLAFGQAKVGTTGAQFLELGVSARSMAMAESFVAVADDISAVYYNPAGLTSLFGKETQFTYIQMPADIGYYFAGAGMPVENIGGVLAVGLYTLSSGQMVETDYYRSTIDGTGRTFGWNDFAFGASYGRYLTDRFSVGFTLKFISQVVHESSASGWSADVGTLYNTGYRGFKIGMVITNFGPDLRMQTASYPLPINFKFGGAINAIETNDNVVTLSAEGWHPSDNLEKYNVGGEWTYKDRFSLRAGGRINYDIGGLTFGGGVKMPFGEEREIRVDYAWQDFGILTQVHRFTLGFAF
jgi:hypothetical protein